MTRDLDIKSFYSEEIEIVRKYEMPNKIKLKLKSRTKTQKCPLCSSVTNHYHSTYMRNIIDLPILGKAVELEITAYKYDYDNEICTQKVFCEELNGLTGKHRRMTTRCEDLIVAIALNTSCEATSMICKHMSISISGDTVIRMLERRAKKTIHTCSEVIGVDDWAFKKGNNYGTIIVDNLTGKPVELLNGRDGLELKKWLEKNKHVKIVTRDRASSYAKAISEALPHAVQVADRFHLYQNLMNAVKDALKKVLPDKIEITNTAENSEIAHDEAISNLDKSKKKLQEKSEIGEERRKEEIHQIQSLYEQGFKKKEIARIMKITPKRVRKYCTGDPENLCKNGNKNIIRKSVIDEFYDQIKGMIVERKLHKDIYIAIKSAGYLGGLSIFNATCGKINKDINRSGGSNKSGFSKEKKKFVTKREIFKYIWSEVPIYKAEKEFVYEKYPEIKIIQDCVKEFRKIFTKKDTSLLTNFISKFASCNISNLQSFAKGLLNDIKAVEQAVTSKYSNGKTEGNNHRLKLIKRTMYGRAKLKLLKAKVLPQPFLIPIYTQN